MNFEIGTGLVCDEERLLVSRMLVQANSGAGKSFALRRLLEQTFGHFQHLVIDPEGEFSTLRERFDYVLAAPTGGDTVAHPRFAAMLAERLRDLGASAILDIYELKPRERVAFVKAFCQALVDLPKKLWGPPCLVVIDEAQWFCPEKGSAESADAVNELVAKGRKRGFCTVLATARIAQLDKDTTGHLNNKLIGRSLDVDAKRAGEELGFTSRREVVSLRELDAGEFYAFGPALSKTVTRVKVGPVQTTHPEVGGRIGLVAPPPSDKVRAMLPQLSDLPAEAEERAQTIETLKRVLASARRDLRTAAKTRTPPDEAVIERRVTTAVAERDKDWQGVQARAEMLERVVKRTGEELSEMGERLLLSLNGSKEEVDGADRRRSRPVQVGGVQPTTRPHSARSRRADESPGDGAAVSERRAAAAAVGGVPDVLGGPETRIVNALAWLEALGVEAPQQEAVAFLAKYRPGGGGFNNPKGRLGPRGKQMIDYLPGGRLRLTDAGRGVAEYPDFKPTNEDVHRAVMEKLDGPERRILQPLLDAWPDPMSNEELMEAAGYQPGGGFNNPRGRLRTLGLIDYPMPGYCVALPLLFPEAQP